MSPRGRPAARHVPPAGGAVLLALALAACRPAEPEGVVAHRELVSGDAPALTVPAGETRVLRHVVIRAEGPGPAVLVRGRLVARDVRVSGGGAAFRVEGGRLDLVHARLEDVETGVWIKDGEARLRDVCIDGARTAGVFLSGGRLDAAGLEVRGGEYGVLARAGAQVSLRDARIEAPEWAGVGLTAARARLEAVAITGGRHGGVVASDLEGPLVVRDLEVRETRGAALQLIRGVLDLESARIEGVSADAQADLGMGLYLEDVRARIRDLSVTRADGEGIVLAGGEAIVSQVAISQCGPAGLLARRGALVSVRDLALYDCRGPAVVADEAARLAVLSGLAPEAEVRCGHGGEVRLPAPLVGADADPCVRPLP